MQLNQIDLNLLVVLDAIYAQGSITGAAEKLHLTQPAVSHALARLRELLDDPLFTRDGRRIVPTPLARTLMEPLRRSLRGLETTLNEVRSFDPDTTTRHFRLGLRDGVEAAVMMPLVERISRIASRVELSSIRFDRRNLEGDLAAGRLDLAIDAPVGHSERVRRQRLGPSGMVVVARKGHPRVKKELDLETYLDLEHVVASSRPEGPGLEDVALARSSHTRKVRMRCQQPFTAFCVIASSDLILTLPEAPATLLNRYFHHTLLPLPLRMPPFDVFLYWHESVEAEPANRWLREQIALAAPTQHESDA
jgi:DNA-binding transcriptional LysR family regulator